MELLIDKKMVTILIADDEPTNRLVAKIALKNEGYNLIEATNGEEALELAKKHRPDVILMDAMMPKMNGFEAIKKIKKIEELENIPILMITALDSKEDKVKAFESGANDYLSKPFDTQELLLRVRSFVKMRYLYIQNKKARIDSTYQLPNLQALRDEVEYAIQPCGLFFQVRDIESLVYFYGLEGTKVIIKDLLKNVKDICRIDNDIKIFALNDDTFVIYWDNQTEVDINKLRSYAKSLFNNVNLKTFGNDIFKNDIKINVAVSSIKDNFINTSLIVLKEAIKKNLPFLVVDLVYQKMTANIEKNMQMFQCINKAIKEDRVIPVYQPILDAKTGKINKYECLVRIKKEDGSLLSPYFFLDIAKQSDQYEMITKIMITKTFEYMKDKNCDFSINLSSIDIEDKEILNFLCRKLMEYQLQNRLIIELLEDEGIHNFEKVLSFIKYMKQMGVRVAIDDYGSGYSNLERIFQFEPGFIKIDGSIIKDIIHDKTKLAIAKSAVYLANEIGIQIVGEFVHNDEVYKKCKEIGIDFLQGYHISEPKEQII